MLSQDAFSHDSDYTSQHRLDYAAVTYEPPDLGVLMQLRFIAHSYCMLNTANYGALLIIDIQGLRMTEAPLFHDMAISM